MYFILERINYYIMKWWLCNSWFFGLENIHALWNPSSLQVVWRLPQDNGLLIDWMEVTRYWYISQGLLRAKKIPGWVAANEKRGGLLGPIWPGWDKKKWKQIWWFCLTFYTHLFHFVREDRLWKTEEDLSPWLSGIVKSFKYLFYGNHIDSNF